MKCLKLLVSIVWFVAMAGVGGASPGDGGGKPRAVSTPKGSAPSAGDAPAPAPAPALPSTSEGVAAAASLSSEDDGEAEVDCLTDNGPLQVDALGFGLDWFPLMIPEFCTQPKDESSLLVMPPDGKLGDWEETWAGIAPGIQNSMKRRDAGRVNQNMRFLRSLMPQVLYDSMANCVLEWWITRLVTDCLAHISAALAEKKTAFYAALAGEEWTDKDRATSWGPLYDHYHTSWNTQMDTLVKRYRYHARAGWGGGGAPVYLLSMGQLSRSRRRRRRRRMGDSDAVTDSSGTEGSTEGVGHRRGRASRGRMVTKRKRVEWDSSEEENGPDGEGSSDETHTGEEEE